MFETILGIALLIMSVFIIIAVLMQHGKSHGLSGTIAGGAETFFGKNKGASIDSLLSKVTTVVSIVFVVVVIIAYVAQDNSSPVVDNTGSTSTTTASADTTAPADTTDPADTTEAADTTDPAETSAAE